MNEWKEYRFDKFVNVNPKVVFSKKENIPFVEMKDIDASNKFCTNSTYRNLIGGSRFENGDTLFARITPCLENGKIAQVRNLTDGKGLGSTEFHVLRGRPDISLSDFVYYLSRWNEVRDFAEINLHGTSGRQRFPADAFKELVLKLPGITEQKSIAEVLSSLDDKIDLLHRQNKTLEQMAETLFRQWFVVEAKDEWKSGLLSDLVIVKYGKDHKSLEDGVIPAFGSGGVMRYVNRPLYEKESVLIPRKGTLSNLFWVDYPFWTVDTMFYTEMKQDYIAKYVYLYLKEQDLASMNVGSAVPSMTTEILNSLPIIIPPTLLLKRFDEEVGLLYNKVSFNKSQILKLEKLRDLLLPKLMNGTVRVINN